MKKPVSEAAVVAFRQEILITSQLRHPNIVEFKGACWGGDLTALILGWCSGGSLEGVLKQRDLEWADPLLRLAADIARGMRFLHSRKSYDEVKGEQQSTVLHRDLKVGRPRCSLLGTLLHLLLFVKISLSLSLSRSLALSPK